MKNLKLATIASLLITVAGCDGNKQSQDGVISVDLSANYPSKDLIIQDFMDVEYIRLETSGEYITRGIVRGVGKNILLVSNKGNEGDIFIFDRKTGKGLKKINREGRGGEEYTGFRSIVLDDENEEILVNAGSGSKIMVYDLHGNFKRVLKLSDECRYVELFNYDNENLICYKSYSPLIENEKSGHILISKLDGSVSREINIPVNGIVSPVVMEKELTVVPLFSQTIPSNGGWIINRASSDTIYTLRSDVMSHMVVRTPSIHSMKTKVFLMPTAESARFFFMHAFIKDLDYDKFSFPTENLVYDKQENSIFRYNAYNGDYDDNKSISLYGSALDHEIVAFKTLAAYDLVEANEKGILKGQLKEIAECLDEESNPVIMLIKSRESEIR